MAAAGRDRVDVHRLPDGCTVVESSAGKRTFRGDADLLAVHPELGEPVYSVLQLADAVRRSTMDTAEAWKRAVAQAPAQTPAQRRVHVHLPPGVDKSTVRREVREDGEHLFIGDITQQPIVLQATVDLSTLPPPTIVNEIKVPDTTAGRSVIRREFDGSITVERSKE